MSDFYSAITRYPAFVLALGLLCLGAMMAGLPKLVKDTSISAFVPDDHPSLKANQLVKGTFGLADAVAIAVVLEPDHSVFQPAVLTLLDTLSQAVGEVPNLREDRVASLTTESSIAGSQGAVEVDDYLPWFEGDGAAFTADDRALASAARGRWEKMPPHNGTLVSADGRAAIIMVEMVDERLALDTWEAVAELVAVHEDVAKRLGAELLLAGPGAVSGYFSAYINKDARVLLPAGFLFVLLFVYLAFVRAKALIGPLLIIIAATGGSLGVMAWAGVSYFAITNSLPVILVAIAVADAIHVLSAYYIEREAAPAAEVRVLVIAAMEKMTRPVLFTTATTMAGFIGLGVVSIMPPISYFAWFATLGVALACVYTLLVLPALLIVLKLGPSPAFSNWQARSGDWLGRGLLSVGRFASRNARWVVGVFLVAGVGAATVAGDLQIDRSQVENFRENEPLRLADERINSLFVGTAFLNLMVTSDQPQGLLQPEQMQAVYELQTAFEALPGVQKTISIVDYLSVLHAALNEQPVTAKRSLPSEPDALAQYLLVYETSGSPTDFEEEISPDYQSALIRGFLNQHRFSETRRTVEALMAHLDSQRSKLSDMGLNVAIAGDVNVTFHWMTRLIESHFVGIGLALCLVFLMAGLMFRSLFTGALAVIPVALTVLAVYGVMAALDIYLDPPSSMFAAIAIGVGVDFSIHLLSRLREVRQASENETVRMPLDQALDLALPETARACLFNALALAVGFSVLMLSLLPTLQRFGGFIALAAMISFIASLLLIPAVMSIAEGARIARSSTPNDPAQTLKPTAAVPGVNTLQLLVLGAFAMNSTPVLAADSLPTLSGLQVAEKVATRAEGSASSKQIDMQLTDKRGRARERRALVIKHQIDGIRYTRVTYLSPKPVREVSFLSHDKLKPGGADHRWLYLPATRKVRRVPASDRGDYFLGTDFSYEDMQSELKFALEDYNFTLVKNLNENDSARGLYRLRGVPKNRNIVRELGYGAFEASIDSTHWMPIEIDFFDHKLKPLKTVTVSDVTQIDGVWNAGSIECTHRRTGHKTLFRFSDIRYLDRLANPLFQPAALSRGVPEL